MADKDRAAHCGLHDAGDSIVSAGSGNDLIFGDGYNDSVAADADNDIGVGCYSNDILFGNQRIDIVYGNHSNDIIVGGMADDAIYGNEGNDLIYGSEGADGIVFGTNCGNDRVTDFSSIEGDWFDLQGPGLYHDDGHGWERGFETFEVTRSRLQVLRLIKSAAGCSPDLRQNENRYQLCYPTRLRCYAGATTRSKSQSCNAKQRL